MITVLYCLVNKIPDYKISDYLLLLPQFMRDDILRSKSIPVLKTRLVARLMLKECLNQTNSAHLLERFDKDRNNKPFIEGWRRFNIAHSGSVSVFAYGNSFHIGIDIEKNVNFGYHDIISNFHYREEEFILKSINPLNAFYEVWVKKEAVLKAMGIGIVNGINNFCTLNEHINQSNKDWYTQKVLIAENYTAFVCSESISETVILQEFIPKP